MKITIIIPNFNDSRVRRALNSIKSQTYTNIEIIVVHGGPLTDKLKDTYNSSIDILINEPDKGIFDALNKGIQIATGDVIYLLGADDYLSGNDIFADVVEQFYNESKPDGICIGCIFVNGEGSVIRKWFPKQVSAKNIKTGLFPPHFSLFLKKDVYRLVGPFKFEQTSNVATDIIWLMDLAFKKPEFKISTLLNHHLNMEYGGASTGSWKGVWRQYKVVHQYAKMHKSQLSNWFLFSLIRTGSKIFQFVVSKR
jgi:glycosyltransferase